MKYTNFEPLVWGNQSFMKVGYDKNKKQLCIFFLNEKIVLFEEVEEITVFQFIISTEKEEFLNKILLNQYDHNCLPSSFLAKNSLAGVTHLFI